MAFKAIEKYGNATAAAKATGIPRSTLRDRAQNWREREARGYFPEYDLDKPAPPGHILERATLRYPATADSPERWIKFKADAAAQAKLQQEALKHLLNGVEPLPVPKWQEADYNTDIIPWINIGDAHIGMIAYLYEVGHDFNLEIAQRELCMAIELLIDRLAPCERIVLQDMGDFVHYENTDYETQNSGHRLDADGRMSRMLQVYIATFQYMIERALAKFANVDVIINQGNHSRSIDLMMATVLPKLYQTERLNVLDNSSVFIPYRMGNTFVMSHHGDKCKPEKLAGVMATDFRQDWGETHFHYIDAGHVHHRKTAIELPGAIYESWNQLAPADQYAHDGGWRSRSCLSVVLRSKTYGEVGRRTVTVEEVKDRIEDALPGTNVNRRREVYTV